MLFLAFLRAVSDVTSGLGPCFPGVSGGVYTAGTIILIEENE